MNLSEILAELNERAPDHAFGKLQDIRKKRRPLQKRPNQHPFRSTSKCGRYAYHCGGRKELQFNVGKDKDGADNDRLRWGIAVSLEPSRSMPDATAMHPKLRKLGSFLETHGDRMGKLGLEMWDWTGPKKERRRSANRPPQRIARDLYDEGTFVFVGKQAPFEAFDPACVLRDFDFLLPIYEHVEFEPDGVAPVLYEPRSFEFQPDRAAESGNRSATTTATRTAGVSPVSLRHASLQGALKRALCREGAEVATEHRDGRGGYIDLVARRDGKLEFYEIKTDATPRLAIRHAVGQLLEYAYWPAPIRPSLLVVVAERPLDEEGEDYLRTLEEETGLPIDYRQVSVPEDAEGRGGRASAGSRTSGTAPPGSAMMPPTSTNG